MLIDVLSLLIGAMSLLRSLLSFLLQLLHYHFLAIDDIQAARQVLG